jgi:translation initiation factor 2B subunit (eIF-2B alpha/beta/delta family)
MARRLAATGAKLRCVYDAALAGAVGRADRVWLGTEGIGADSFSARVGSRAMLEEARRLEVPTCLLATSDKLLPAGELRLPAWADHETWLLWEDAPDGVRLDSQPWEAVPLSLVDVVATEHGPERAADLALRCLRTDTAR